MIDSHLHIWDLNKNYYTWLTSELDAIYRSFTIEEYQTLCKPLKVDGCILIQAADNIKESHFLLDAANKNSIVKGVIGWVDFTSPTVIDDLQALSNSTYFKGVRPMLQDIADSNWIMNKQFQPIFKFLEENNLIFEALIRQEHLAQIIQIAQNFPQLSIVINHGAKPKLQKQSATQKRNDRQWHSLMSQAATCQNIHCKLSGLVTECPESNLTTEELLERMKPMSDHMIQTFGPDRIIWGSDWPVVNLKCSFQQWFDLSKKLLSDLDTVDQQRIYLKNALSFYRLENLT